MLQDSARSSSGAIEAHLPFLRRYARALMQDRDAADSLVRGCLERAVTGDGPTPRDTSLRVWLLRLLHQERARRTPETHRAEAWFDGGGETAEARRFRAAFDRLSAEEREILLLTGLEGLTTEESSKVLGVDAATARIRATRARERLCLLQCEAGAPLSTDLAWNSSLAVGSAA